MAACIVGCVVGAGVVRVGEARVRGRKCASLPLPAPLKNCAFLHSSTSCAGYMCSYIHDIHNFKYPMMPKTCLLKVFKFYAKL